MHIFKFSFAKYALLRICLLKDTEEVGEAQEDRVVVRVFLNFALIICLVYHLVQLALESFRLEELHDALRMVHSSRDQDQSGKCATNDPKPIFYVFFVIFTSIHHDFLVAEC